MNDDAVTDWVQRYVHAWETSDPSDIAALFLDDAEYRMPSGDTAWLGRQAIVEGWLGRQGRQAGGWSFTWDLLATTGNTAAVRGIGDYPAIGTFDNLWVITLDDSGRASSFLM
jgi:uncharacterized protein (TIGR02246 family)